MTALGLSPLVDPILGALGIEHGFGQRETAAPEDTSFRKQVHGTNVSVATESRATDEPADAVVTCVGGVSVGIVTADCVPILVASENGIGVAAIHAGWRGLAAGVIEAGVEKLRAEAGQRSLVAAIGPAARGCCYEIDEPVWLGLGARYGVALEDEAILRPTEPGHAMLDLAALAARALEKCGLKTTKIGYTHCLCTICSPDRFESFRRDGATAGRLRHYIRSKAASFGQG